MKPVPYDSSYKATTPNGNGLTFSQWIREAGAKPNEYWHAVSSWQANENPRAWRSGNSHVVWAKRRQGV